MFYLCIHEIFNLEVYTQFMLVEWGISMAKTEGHRIFYQLETTLLCQQLA